MYFCEHCNIEFKKRDQLNAHNNRKIKCYEKENKYKYKCDYCHKKFSSKSNLNNHIKISCKTIKKQSEDIKNIFNRLKILEEENQTLRKKTKNITNNTVITNSHNITNNTINNITLIGYGKEDFTKLSENKIKRILNKGYMSCVGLTDAIHFNPKYPEYHNIYISSMKDKYAMMYDGTNWKLVGKNELIDSIYDDKKDYIEENIDDFCDSLTGSKKTAIYDWLQMEHDDDKIKEMKEEIKLLLYNKKHIPIKLKTIL
jgi:hypothetical protein